MFGIFARTLMTLAPKRVVKSAAKPAARATKSKAVVAAPKKQKAPANLKKQKTPAAPAASKAKVFASKRRIVKALKVAGVRKPAQKLLPSKPIQQKKKPVQQKKKPVQQKPKKVIVTKNKLRMPSKTAAKKAPAVAVAVAAPQVAAAATADDCPFAMYASRVMPQLTDKVVSPADKFAVVNAAPVETQQQEVVVESATEEATEAVSTNDAVHFDTIAAVVPAAPVAAASVVAAVAAPAPFPCAAMTAESVTESTTESFEQEKLF